MASFEKLFNQLQSPSPSTVRDAESLTACAVPGWPGYRIVRDVNGAPGLLVPLPKPTTARHAGVELKNLSFRPDVRCVVQSEDTQVVDGRFALVRCKATERDLGSLFLSVIEGWLPELGRTPDQHELAEAVDRLVELFAALSKPGTMTVQGIWAELWLIVASGGASTLVKAWHSEPDELYDFVGGLQRLEVKSTSGPLRQHHFSLDQLQPPDRSRLVVASIFVEEDPSGASVRELLGQLRDRLVDQPELFSRAQEIVASGLGREWRDAAEGRFNVARAASSLSFFAGEAIPRVDPALPPEVSQVRFQADLSGLDSLAMTVVRDLGGIFASAVPTGTAQPERAKRA